MVRYQRVRDGIVLALSLLVLVGLGFTLARQGIDVMPAAPAAEAPYPSPFHR